MSKRRGAPPGDDPTATNFESLIRPTGLAPREFWYFEDRARLHRRAAGDTVSDNEAALEPSLVESVL